MIQFAPFDYTKIRKNYEELNKFDYIMGRAMFETNSLPKVSLGSGVDGLKFVICDFWSGGLI